MMKKITIFTLVVILSLALIYTSASAQGGMQQQGGNQTTASQQRMHQYEMMHVNVEAIADAISQLDNEEARQALTALLQAYQIAAAGDSLAREQEAKQELYTAIYAAGLQIANEPMDFTFNYVRDYGRYLQIDQIAAAIGTVTESETADMLTALLDAYQTALRNGDTMAVSQALEALAGGLETTGLQAEEHERLLLYKVLQGCCLDTIAIEALILEMPDPDTVAALLPLLDTYMMTSSGGSIQAAQEAFAALIQALRAAGIEI